MIGPAAAARSLDRPPVLAMTLSVVIALVTVWTASRPPNQSNWPLGFFVGVPSAPPSSCSAGLRRPSAAA